MSEPRKRRWRRIADAIPTRWFFLSVGLVVVLASAAFGGLNDAPAQAIDHLSAGKVHSGLRLDVSVTKAVLIDGFPDTDISTPDGKRLLVVVAHVTNHWHAPVTPASISGVADTIALHGVPGITDGAAPDTVALLSDATTSPTLQPGVPDDVTFIWNVDPAALAAGDTLHLRLMDEDLHVNGDLLTGESFEKPHLVGTVRVVVTDVGAGSDG